ncbi:unnamed protein product, partial [Mesorhabditis spiculigera]
MREKWISGMERAELMAKRFVQEPVTNFECAVSFHLMVTLDCRALNSEEWAAIMKYVRPMKPKLEENHRLIWSTERGILWRDLSKLFPRLMKKTTLFTPGKLDILYDDPSKVHDYVKRLGFILLRRKDSLAEKPLPRKKKRGSRRGHIGTFEDWLLEEESIHLINPQTSIQPLFAPKIASTAVNPVIAILSRIEESSEDEEVTEQPIRRVPSTRSSLSADSANLIVVTRLDETTAKSISLKEAGPSNQEQETMDDAEPAIKVEEQGLVQQIPEESRRLSWVEVDETASASLSTQDNFDYSTWRWRGIQSTAHPELGASMAVERPITISMDALPTWLRPKATIEEDLAARKNFWKSAAPPPVDAQPLGPQHEKNPSKQGILMRITSMENSTSAKITFDDAVRFAKDFGAGSVAATIAKTVIAPVERVKLILQLQSAQPTLAVERRYKGPMDCFIRLPKEQGFLSFWRGNGSNIIRSCAQESFGLAFKELYRKLILADVAMTDYSQQFIGNIVAGALSGLTTLTIIYPLDFTRTRLAIDMGKDASDREFRGLSDCIRKIVKADGVRGLYVGLLPSMQYIMLYRGAYYGLFDWAKPFIAEGEKQDLSFTKAFLLGQVTTLVAGLCSYPLDTVRRRLMMESGQGKISMGTMKCAKLLLHNEGWKAFYSGAFVNVIRGTGAALVLAFYNEMHKYM